MFLFQLPPSFKRDLDVLDQFLATLPPGARAAFEFRHVSWHATEVFERLAARGAAACVADSERLTTPVEVTALYAYFWLRDERGTATTISPAGATRSRRTGDGVRRSSSTSSTKKRGRVRNWPGS